MAAERPKATERQEPRCLVRPAEAVSPKRVAPPTASAAAHHALYLQRTVGNGAAATLLQRARGKNKGGGNTKTSTTKTQTTNKTTTTTTARPATRNTTPAALGDFTTIWWVDPMSLRYAQDTIDRNFTDRKFGTVDMAAKNIKQQAKEGKTTLFDAMTTSPLRVVERSGRLISLDHRRLWVFKHAGVALVPIRRATADEMNADAFKFTSALTHGQALGSDYVGVIGMAKNMMEGDNPLKVQRPRGPNEEGVKELEGGVKYW